MKGLSLTAVLTACGPLALFCGVAVKAKRSRQPTHMFQEV